MKKALFILTVALISTNVMANDTTTKGPKGKPSGDHKGMKGEKPDWEKKFVDGCLDKTQLKGPMANDADKMDKDGDGCITKEEMKSFKEEHKGEWKKDGEGKGQKGGKKGNK